MIRDVLNAVVASVNQKQPPTVGLPVVTPAPSNTGTGVVSFDASNQIFGTFNGLLVVTLGGTPGTAQAKLSLDNGNNVGTSSQGNFDQPFTLPSTVPGYPVPVPSLTPSNASQVLSGLVLNFSGTFNIGDTFSFQALPSVLFLMGGEEKSSQDSLYPRVIFHPTEDDFGLGTEDYAQNHAQDIQQRPLLTDVATFETHCWGLDYDRAEILRDTVINGIHFAFQAAKRILRGSWVNDEAVGQAGKLYVLNWTVRKPVLQLEQDTIVAQPPFTGNFSTSVINQP